MVEIGWEERVVQSEVSLVASIVLAVIYRCVSNRTRCSCGCQNIASVRRRLCMEVLKSFCH